MNKHTNKEFEKFKIAIGEQIAELRKDAGFSQGQLARMINVNQGTISRLESGVTQDPPVKLIFDCLDILRHKFEFELKSKD